MKNSLRQNSSLNNDYWKVHKLNKYTVMDQYGNELLSARQHNPDYFEIAQFAAMAPQMRNCLEDTLEFIQELEQEIENFVIPATDPRYHALTAIVSKFKRLNG